MEIQTKLIDSRLIFFFLQYRKKKKKKKSETVHRSLVVQANLKIYYLTQLPICESRPLTADFCLVLVYKWGSGSLNGEDRSVTYERKILKSLHKPRVLYLLLVVKCKREYKEKPTIVPADTRKAKQGHLRIHLNFLFFLKSMVSKRMVSILLIPSHTFLLKILFLLFAKLAAICWCRQLEPYNY